MIGVVRDLGIALLVPVLSIAAPGQSESSTLDLSHALNRLQSAIAALPPESNPERIQKATTWLLRNYDASTQVSADYTQSILAAAELVAKRPVPSLTKGPMPSRELLDAVAEDLEAKVEHCKALGLGMGGAVLLRVQMLGALDPAEWRVWYLPKLFERSGRRGIAFPVVGSPVEHTVPPGLYLIWAEDPKQERKTPRTEILAAKTRELPVQLVLP
jgi:hypothetical protein